MYVGPGGAEVLVKGSCAIQALKATCIRGLKRRCATASADGLLAKYAVNHASKAVESNVRWFCAVSVARFASVRAAEALASRTDDSVLHLAEA